MDMTGYAGQAVFAAGIVAFVVVVFVAQYYIDKRFGTGSAWWSFRVFLTFVMPLIMLWVFSGLFQMVWLVAHR